MRFCQHTLQCARGSRPHLQLRDGHSPAFMSCMPELHSHARTLARLACDTSENHLVSHDASTLSGNEAAGRETPVRGGRWRQQKSFEEVDAYLQGHTPPGRSKRLEDVFDGETTLLFQSTVAQRHGSHREGRRAILIQPPVT